MILLSDPNSMSFQAFFTQPVRTDHLLITAFFFQFQTIIPEHQRIPPIDQYEKKSRNHKNMFVFLSNRIAEAADNGKTKFSAGLEKIVDARSSQRQENSWHDRRDDDGRERR